MLDKPIVQQKTRRNDIEFKTQCAIVQLLKLNTVAGCIYFHPANGESRSARTGARLKLMGVRPGVADIALVLPDGRAAFLEVKAPKEYQSPVQRVFEKDLSISGAPYAVVRSVDEAHAVLKSWGAVR